MVFLYCYYLYLHRSDRPGLYPLLDVWNVGNSVHQVGNLGESTEDTLVREITDVMKVWRSAHVKLFPTKYWPPLLSSFFSSCPRAAGTVSSYNFFRPASSLAKYNFTKPLIRSWMASTISST